MTLLLAAGLALARPVSADSPDSHLSSTLAALSHAAENPASFEAFVASHPRFAGESVQIVVELVPGAHGDALAEVRGAVVEARADRRIQLRVPVAQLRWLAAHPDVHHVREPFRADAKEVEGEGYAGTMADDWHEGGEVTGAGVHVGVLDVGFLGSDTLIGTELPDDVATDFSLGAPDASAHGTAVAEVLADFVPDARFTLVSFGTDVEFGAGLQALLDADVDVVNASVGFDNVWAADGTSAPTRYADAMVEAGVIFVGAAGNEHGRYRVAELTRVEGTQYVEIGGHYAIAASAPGGRARASFRWSEPFGEAASDLDLVVFDASSQRECGRSENPQDGDDNPYEEIDVSGCEEQVYVAVYADPSVEVAGLTGYLYARAGVDDAERTGIESLSLPADCLRCVSVGAYRLDDQNIAAYSSQGPTNDGRTKPDFVAPTDVSTATEGASAFEGTSAATPHVSGLAALWVQATGQHAAPDEFKAWAAEGALDLGPDGVDNTYGHGAVQGGAVPPLDCGCSAAGGGAPATGAALGIAGFALARRRR